MKRIIDLLSNKKYLAIFLAIILIISIVLIWSWLVNSPPPSTQDDIPGSDTVAAARFFVDIVLKLGLVILLIFMSVNLMRWLQNKSGAGGMRKMVIMESLRLSPRQAIHLIRIGSKEILIGATDQSISRLLDLEINSEENPLILEPTTPKSFSSMLKSVMTEAPPDEEIVS